MVFRRATDRAGRPGLPVKRKSRLRGAVTLLLCPLLLARLTQNQLRHAPRTGGFHTRPREVDGKLLPTFRLASEVQRNNAASV